MNFIGYFYTLFTSIKPHRSGWLLLKAKQGKEHPFHSLPLIWVCLYLSRNAKIRVLWHDSRQITRNARRDFGRRRRLASSFSVFFCYSPFFLTWSDLTNTLRRELCVQHHTYGRIYHISLIVDALKTHFCLLPLEVSHVISFCFFFFVIRCLVDGLNGLLDGILVRKLLAWMSTGTYYEDTNCRRIKIEPYCSCC